jgi:hypothetical protein
MADLTFMDHGTIVTMRPDTDAGREWVETNIPDDAMTFGGAIVIEHRYANAIIDGAANDGLEVST